MTAQGPVLGLVCARGGSRGVPRKSLAMLAGLPLVAHTVNAYRAWGGADRVVCSTDDPDTAEAARAAGAEVPWLRPAELAGDDVAKRDVLRHALLACEAEDGHSYEVIVDLDVCAPLRTVADIEAVLATLTERGASNVLSVSPARRNPYYNMVEVTDEGWARLSKPPGTAFATRQASPVVYDVNASIYAYTRAFLLSDEEIIGSRTAVYVMPAERSVDVDNPVDLLLLRALVDSGAALPPAPPQG